MLARLGKLFGIVSSSELMSSASVFGCSGCMGEVGWWVCLWECVCVCESVRWLVGIYHTARTGSLNVCFKLCRHQLSLSPHATVCGHPCGCFCECICLCVASLGTDCKQLIQNFNCQCWNYALVQRTSGSQTSAEDVWENPGKTDLTNKPCTEKY